MRASSVVIVAVLLLTAPRTLWGQGSSTSTKPTAPKEILGKSIKDWVKDLKDPDPAVRVNAAQILVHFGESARKDAGPPLINALSMDRDATMRVTAAQTITSIGLEAKDVPEAVKVISQRMQADQQAIVRYHLAMLAAQIGPDARAIIPQLIDRAKDQGSFEIRKAAIYALGNVGASYERTPADPRAIGALIDAFAGIYPDTSSQVRLEAVIALSSIGNAGTPQERVRIESAFKKAMTDKEKSIGIWAHVGLMAHGEVNEKDLDAISKHLKPNEPYNLRVQSCRALGILGPKGKARLTELMDCLGDKEPLFVMVAVWAIGEIGEGAERAVPMLEELDKKKDTNDQVKAAIKDALPKITGKKPAKSP